MKTDVFTYIIIAIFFAMDFFLRKKKQAKSLTITKDDNYSTKLIVFTFVIILITAELLTIYNIGFFENLLVAYCALFMMALGVVTRIYSMLILKEAYTRTLLTTDKQELTKTGIYKIIRHPGYLGTILIWAFFGLSIQNYLVALLAILLILTAYVYRINNEEKMLLKEFGDEYKSYKTKTWRLIPYIW